MAEVSKITVKIGADTFELTRGINKAKKETSAFGKSIKKLGGLIAGAFAVSAIVGFTKEAIKMAGAFEGVKIKFDTLGVSIKNLRQAVKGTVSDLDLMKSTNVANELGLDVKEMARLFAFAELKAKEMGESTTFMVESISKGIGRKSVLILDNLGISAIALKEAMGGVSLEAASVADVTKAVGKIADKSLGEVKDAALTTGEQLQTMNAQWTNFTIKMGEAIAGSKLLSAALSLILATTQKLLGADISEALPKVDRIKEIKEKLTELNAELATLPEAAKNAGYELDNLPAEVEEAIKKIKDEIISLNAELVKLTYVAEKAIDPFKIPLKSLDGIGLFKDRIIEAKNEATLLKNELGQILGITQDNVTAANEWQPTFSLLKQDVEDVGINSGEAKASMDDWISGASTGINQLSNTFSRYYSNQLKSATLTDEKRSELLTKMAKADKAGALLAATVNTAAGVTSALRIPPPLGQILAGINAGLGAAQIGVIASTPIPAFAEGGAAAFSKPTLSMLGEAPGISRSNPEIMGTAKQLSGMFGGGYGEVRFRIGIGELEGILRQGEKNNKAFS